MAPWLRPKQHLQLRPGGVERRGELLERVRAGVQRSSVDLAAREQADRVGERPAARAHERDFVHDRRPEGDLCLAVERRLHHHGAPWSDQLHRAGQPGRPAGDIHRDVEGGRGEVIG